MSAIHNNIAVLIKLILTASEPWCCSIKDRKGQQSQSSLQNCLCKGCLLHDAFSARLPYSSCWCQPEVSREDCHSVWSIERGWVSSCASWEIEDQVLKCLLSCIFLLPIFDYLCFASACDSIIVLSALPRCVCLLIYVVVLFSSLSINLFLCCLLWWLVQCMIILLIIFCSTVMDHIFGRVKKQHQIRWRETCGPLILHG